MRPRAMTNDQAVELGLVESLSHEILRRPCCIPKVNGEFVAAMEDVLDLTPNPTTQTGRWCASTRPPPNR